MIIFRYYFMTNVTLKEKYGCSYHNLTIKHSYFWRQLHLYSYFNNVIYSKSNNILLLL